MAELMDEYKQMFDELGDAGAAFFKFFDSFRINLGDGEGLVRGLHYGKDCSWYQGTDEELRQLKTYWKAQKSWLRKEGKNVSPIECRRRMWFWISKLKEYNAFDLRIRRDILYWMDTCIERSLDGSMVRIEYLNGQPIVAKIPQKE
jgi:hypothetical protein